MSEPAAARHVLPSPRSGPAGGGKAENAPGSAGDPRPGSPRELVRGSIVWAQLDPTVGREQTGRRPALVVASTRYLATATSLAIIVPVTTVNRGWPNHIRLRGDNLGLDRASYAMTEQPRTIDRTRITSVVGVVDETTLREVEVWLRDFFDLPARSS